ncbi:hypothetical protein F2P47_00545 [Parvibaculum sedimenti]|uniref:SPOR domain-containing protein n=3 Tax=Parvibaculum sedimenti TaxID=2608632 RepID=A0A6N6VN60_9HYPH|nr:SPOR domain-containing protein [Parvibaculum sedimenti]KAB7742657.1 hypothetical protein F2P47_00545 [Parvibaculum sedimenti]
MSKKPASLTSDLLARKGEAEPLSIDPSARMSLFAEPDYPTGGGTDRRDEGERPQPPEPEIIYTAEETSSGFGSSRLVIGAVLGAIVIGGVLLVMSNKSDRGVAPVAPDMTAQTTTPEATPAAPVAQAPAPEAAVPEDAAPAASAPAMSTAGTTIVPTVPAEQSAAPAPAQTPSQAPAQAASVPAPAVQVSEAPVAQAAAPAPEAQAPAAPAEEAAPAAAAPKPAKIAAAGAWVVQISALRDEKSAHAAWSKLTKRFPAVLGGHALNIEKADLGAKGTYYRVRAAGFASKSAAQSACGKLKAGGQDCMVKKR